MALSESVASADAAGIRDYFPTPVGRGPYLLWQPRRPLAECIRGVAMKLTTITACSAFLVALPLGAQTVPDSNAINRVAVAMAPHGRYLAPICHLTGGDFRTSSAGLSLKNSAEGIQEFGARARPPGGARSTRRSITTSSPRRSARPATHSPTIRRVPPGGTSSVAPTSSSATSVAPTRRSRRSRPSIPIAPRRPSHSGSGPGWRWCSRAQTSCRRAKPTPRWRCCARR